MSQAADARHGVGAAAAGKLSLALLWAQGTYYLITGLWPLLSIETFLLVTGPKTDHLMSPNPTPADHWLVMTVGALITAVGAALLTSAWRRHLSWEIAVLAIGCAVGLTAIDIVYVLRRVLPPIYLADAAAESVLIVVWLAALVQQPLR
jgi:hypothetical protein